MKIFAADEYDGFFTVGKDITVGECGGFFNFLTAVILL